MYKCSRVRKLLYILKFGIRPIDIEIEYRIDNGAKKFVFIFEPTEEENELINKAKDIHENMNAEDFNRYYDLYWQLINEKYPKRR